MKAISVRVKDRKGYLTVWFPGLSVSAYTTKVELRGRLSQYEKDIKANKSHIQKMDEIALIQDSFVNYLESVSHKQILPDGMVVYTIKNPKSLSKVDFSVITNYKAAVRPIYFVDDKGDLAALWVDGKFWTKENPEFDLYLPGFRMTKFGDRLSIV